MPPTEELLSISQAARQLHVSPATLWRWHSRGCRGIKLRTIAIGVRRYTTAFWIDEFIAGTTDAANERLTTSDRADHERTERSAETQRRLEAAGLA